MSELGSILPSGIAHSIEHNPHRACYDTIEKWLDLNSVDVDPVELAQCLRTDELWVLYWYPSTPIGSCVVAASTFTRCVDAAHREVEIQRDARIAAAEASPVAVDLRTGRRSQGVKEEIGRASVNPTITIVLRSTVLVDIVGGRARYREHDGKETLVDLNVYDLTMVEETFHLYRRR